MTAKITLTWDNGSSEHVDQIVYRSAETFTVDNLPPALARVGRNVREYIDTDIVTGNVYFYAVASENASGEVLLSSVIPVTAEVSTGDPHWDNVVSLLHFDGDLTDEVGRVWANVNSSFETANPLMGTGSLKLSGAANSGISTSSIITDSSAPYTIEATISRDSSTTGGIISQAANARCGEQGLHITAEGKLVFSNGGRGCPWKIGGVASTSSLPIGEPIHVALTYDGEINRLFLNGILEGSAISIGGWVNTGTQFLIGNLRVPSFGVVLPFGGLIDEVRITVGVARYTENFTPPTEPFPNF